MPNQYPADFKAEVVLEIIQEEANVNEIAAKQGMKSQKNNRDNKCFV